MTTTIPPANLIENCTACGRVILVAVAKPGGVYSEFRDKKGRCFKCSRKGSAVRR